MMIGIIGIVGAKLGHIRDDRAEVVQHRLPGGSASWPVARRRRRGTLGYRWTSNVIACDRPYRPAWFGFLFRVVARIGGERSRNIIALLELAVLVATDVSFIGSCIDQFALAHRRTPLGLLHFKNACRRRKMHGINHLGATRERPREQIPVIEK